MSTSIFVLLLANLAYIGLLPALFFRRDGKLNYKWWLTASPFFVSGLLVALQYFGLLQPWYLPRYAAAMETVATVFAGLSLGLISYTLGTHRRPLALWHQRDDAPEHIVTEGAYKRIRHPFYASFIATLAASAVLCGSPWAVAISVGGMLMLNYTAAGEEKRLLESALGQRYRAYLAHSGRFFPSFR